MMTHFKTNHLFSIFILAVLLTIPNSWADNLKTYQNLIKKLKNIEQNISQTNQKILTSNQQINQFTVNIKILNKEQKQLIFDIKFHKKLIAQQLRQLQKIHKQPIIKRILFPESYSKTLRHQHYLLTLRRAHLNTITALQYLNTDLLSKETQIYNTVKKLNQEKKQLTEKRVQLLDQSQKRKKQIQQLKSLLKQEKVAEFAKTNLTKTYKKTITNLPKRSNNIQNVAFSQLKGKINWPSIGTYKPLKEFNNRAWQVSHQEPTEIHSIADGTVIAKTWLPQLGNIIVIDHGENYSGVYGNNSLVKVKVGQKIKGNQVIALSGNSGGRENIGSFFQLWYKKNPANFSQWIKKQV